MYIPILRYQVPVIKKTQSETKNCHEARNKPMSVKSTTACLFVLKYLKNRILSAHVDKYELFESVCFA